MPPWSYFKNIFNALVHPMGGGPIANAPETATISLSVGCPTQSFKHMEAGLLSSNRWARHPRLYIKAGRIEKKHLTQRIQLVSGSKSTSYDNS